MACGANFAWAITGLLHGVRQAFATVFGRSVSSQDMPLVYDVCHNIAKMEEYEIDGVMQRVCVHRKGASERPRQSSCTARTVSRGGAASAHTQGIWVDTHLFWLALLVPSHRVSARAVMVQGVGRAAPPRRSRYRAGSYTINWLLRASPCACIAKGCSLKEAPSAYKDAQQVVNVVHDPGLARLVARLKPVVGVKG